MFCCCWRVQWFSTIVWTKKKIACRGKRRERKKRNTIESVSLLASDNECEFIHSLLFEIMFKCTNTRTHIQQHKKKLWDSAEYAYTVLRVWAQKFFKLPLEIGWIRMYVCVCVLVSGRFQNRLCEWNIKSQLKQLKKFQCV